MHVVHDNKHNTKTEQQRRSRERDSQAFLLTYFGPGLVPWLFIAALLRCCCWPSGWWQWCGSLAVESLGLGWKGGGLAKKKAATSRFP